LGCLELLQRSRLTSKQQALGLLGGPDAVAGGVIAEVLPHRRLVDQHLDLAQHQVFRGADPGEHQQLW
jgi:hypothetical protein